VVCDVFGGQIRTDPDTAKDFPLKIPSLKNSVDELLRNPNAWNQPALKDKINATAVPVRIKGPVLGWAYKLTTDGQADGMTHNRCL